MEYVSFLPSNKAEVVELLCLRKQTYNSNIAYLGPCFCSCLHCDIVMINVVFHYTCICLFCYN